MDATPSLPDLLDEIPDPRRAEGKRHPLPAVLSLLVLAMLAGMRGLQGIVDFGRNLPRTSSPPSALRDPRRSPRARSRRSFGRSTSTPSRRRQPMAPGPGRPARLDGDRHRRQEPSRHRGRTTARRPPRGRLRARSPGRPGPAASRQQDQRAQGGAGAAGVVAHRRGRSSPPTRCSPTRISAGTSARPRGITSWPSRTTNRRCCKTSRPPSPPTRRVPPYQQRRRDAARTRATAAARGTAGASAAR